jgi:hypothetical protein
LVTIPMAVSAMVGCGPSEAVPSLINTCEAALMKVHSNTASIARVWCARFSVAVAVAVAVVMPANVPV